ncbi:hypothetical protein J6590_084588 [Homalodisca vitripennis]|nr:hypothetical protein J6590_084588 [Homalodisca vitripennis]
MNSSAKDRRRNYPKEGHVHYGTIPWRDMYIMELSQGGTCTSWNYPMEGHVLHHGTIPRRDMYIMELSHGGTCTTSWNYPKEGHVHHGTIPRRDMYIMELSHGGTCTSWNYPMERNVLHHGTIPRRDMYIMELPQGGTCTSWNYPMEGHVKAPVESTTEVGRSIKGCTANCALDKIIDPLCRGLKSASGCRHRSVCETALSSLRTPPPTKTDWRSMSNTKTSWCWGSMAPSPALRREKKTSLETVPKVKLRS